VRNTKDRVAVASRSFSTNPVLRAELLERYELVTFNEEGRRLAGQDLVAFLRGHEKAITALEVIDQAVIAELRDLKVLSKYGVGIDMVDTSALKAAGIGFGWTKGVNRRSVSELVLSAAISLLHLVPAAMAEVQAGQWRQLNGNQLTEKTVGIVGCGHVGRDLIELLGPFGCRVLVNDIVDLSDCVAETGCEQVDLETLMRLADVVTVHTPLDETTRGLIGAAEIALMQSHAVIINMARGGIVDEAALLAGLEAGQLAAAALDVLEVEPPTTETAAALIRHPRVVVTPHIGGSAKEAVLAMGRAAIAGLDNYVL
jgi:D-3-phosphoglycerate dehydrogenase